jgi:hypothetical protein
MAISKAYDVGDSVWVSYPFPNSNYFAPVNRTVSSVKIISDTDNKAEVRFTTGEQVIDDDTTTTVYTTQALAATAIVNDVITRVDSTVNLDPTTTVASTAAQTALSLGRVDS